MIKRIVRLTFREAEVETFRALFERTKTNIRHFPGCLHLELLQAADQPNVFFTWSYWENAAALEAYRHSDLFKETWQQTKVLFADKPYAQSLIVASTTNP
ncbi:MAG: antibiotic biosynthesis monooxygenase [Phaeodactylibacter sp.]|nr:antibiotic biosynthesis monooxygenase [Phaeodactylibacter sp.]